LSLHPEDQERGERILTTGQAFYLDSSDVEKFKIGMNLRLKDLYNIQIDEVHDERVLAHLKEGKPDLTVPKIQWVPVEEATPITLNFPDVLFRNEQVNPDSLIVRTGWAENSLQRAEIGEIVQLERLGLGRIDIKKDLSIHINMCEKWPENR
ncbi:MAG: hypothetical protein ACXADX_09670, partial [Candidatus Hodarchaeales archaeon]